MPKNCTLDKIKYFTARVTNTANDPTKATRQDVFFRALKAHIPEFEIIEGHYQTTKVYAPLVTPINNQKYVRVFKTEEKGSDVNLAVHLLNDAWLEKYDLALVISNDSDLTESINLVKEHRPALKIGIITPGDKRRTAHQLKQTAHFCKQIRSGLLKVCQMPNPIPGTSITKPAEWD